MRSSRDRHNKWACAHWRAEEATVFVSICPLFVALDSAVPSSVATESLLMAMQTIAAVVKKMHAVAWTVRAAQNVAAVEIL